MSSFGLWVTAVLGSTAASTVLLGLISWLLREWISARLTAGLRVETEQQLASFRSRLEAAERQVTSVRQAGLEAARSANAVVMTERVLATKEFTRTVTESSAAATISMIIAAMTPDWVHRNATQPGTRNTADMLLKAAKAQELLARMHALGMYRPFITERSWALFTALHSFYAARILKCVALQLGNAELAERLWAVDAERKLLETILPDKIAAYDRNPVETEVIFVETVRNQLLEELRRGLSGEHSGSEAVRQATAISAATDEAMRALELTQKPEFPGLRP